MKLGIDTASTVIRLENLTSNLLIVSLEPYGNFCAMPPGAQFQIGLGAGGVIEDLQVEEGWLTVWINGDVSVFHRGVLLLDYGVSRLGEQAETPDDGLWEAELGALDEWLRSDGTKDANLIIGALNTLTSENYPRARELLERYLDHSDKEVRHWVQGVYSRHSTDP